MSRSRKRKSDDLRLFDSSVCAFCGTDYKDEIKYGKFLKSDEISVHTYCMFFASGLGQHGESESDGFYGFLLPDIEAELRRGKKLFCTYCRKRGATVGCCDIKCKKSFHLPCGVEHDSLNQHFGSFLSFCKDHRPKQKYVNVSDELYCYICCEEIAQQTLKYCLYSPCCKNNWFHKICIQKYAVSAGSYFFKCPLCNNSEEFVKEMTEQGIFIPERDASWELEENAYQELLVRPVCDVEVCKCPKGRQYNSKRNSGWSLLPCSNCGSHARHKTCESLKLSVHSWKCEECKSIEKKIISNKEMSALNTEVKNLRVEVSSSKNFGDPTSGSPSSFNSFSSPSVTLSKGDTFQLAIPDIIASNQVRAETSDTGADLNTGITANSNMLVNVEVKAVKVSERTKETARKKFKYHPRGPKSKDNDQEKEENLKEIKNFVSSSNILNAEVKAVKIREHPEEILGKDLGSASKITMQEKQGNNFEVIQSLSPNVFDVLRKSSIDFKARAVKRTIKKRKIESPCSNSKQCCCIRKYYGQECGKYRL